MAWHALTVEEALRRLGTERDSGLSETEATQRLAQVGKNELPQEAPRSFLFMLADQFKDIVIWILLGAALVSAFLRDVTDAIVIIAIVVLNATLGVLQESKAEKSLAALRQLSAPQARVLRDGVVRDVPSGCVVPGDLVLLEAGNFVPADLRLVETVNLRVDEASLTGESVPAEKRAKTVLDAADPPGDRINVAYAGTLVVLGRGRGVVTQTGSTTELGNIAALLESVDQEKTPLQARLEGLGRTIALVVLGICVVVFVSGLLRGLPALNLFLTSISLAVAAIPEGLPAVVTIVLALGVGKMVRRHVIVRRLRAVEALGSTTVICTDKTGTLTQNEMTVRHFWADHATGTVTGAGYAPQGEFTRDGRPVDLPTQPGLGLMLEIAGLCNNAGLERRDGQWRILGDPTEGALLVAARKAGPLPHASLNEAPRVQELPFDADRKRMSTFHRLPDGRVFMAVKGAPDSVLGVCASVFSAGASVPLSDPVVAAIEDVNRNFAGQALRVLGFAYRVLDELPDDPCPDDVEEDLTFVGLLGMIDPPRGEVRGAIQLCNEAGIQVVMITGDHSVTAQAIAMDLDLPHADAPPITGAELATLSDAELRERIAGTSVYARVSPADKLRIVAAYQSLGHIVAMTGDGVNDAPALKKAEIGVAMGLSGTDVAKGAADIVLTDDNFASIVAAVEEGRGIFDNIRKFVYYLLSCNISEVLTIFLAIMVGLPLPLLAVQLLWVNLVTDGLPALALGLEPKEPGLMKRPPRDPAEGVLNRTTVRDIVWFGGVITVAALAAYAHGLYWLVLVPMGHTGTDALQSALRSDFWTNPAVRQHPAFAPGLIGARTLTFGTLAFCQLGHALNSRSETHSLFRLGLATNPHLLGAIAISALAQLVVIYMPAANDVFKTIPITGIELLVGVGLAASPLLFGEAWKWYHGRKTGIARPQRIP